MEDNKDPLGFFEKDEGFDDDGNPTTIEAAIKTYHKNNNPFYCANASF
jgi:hypothetical protein